MVHLNLNIPIDRLRSTFLVGHTLSTGWAEWHRILLGFAHLLARGPFSSAKSTARVRIFTMYSKYIVVLTASPIHLQAALN